jgi:hypothetical protein
MMLPFFKKSWMLALPILVLILTACCKAICGGDENLTFSTGAIAKKDADTIYMIGYEPGSNFTIRRDSIPFIFDIPQNDLSPSNFRFTLEITKEWKVEVPGILKTYYFTNYVYTNSDCKVCGKRYIVRSVAAYQVNNVKTSAKPYVLQ